MTLRLLKIFITVADLRSMTAASKALFVAQPTVSQAIAELEAYYGVRLFDRLSKRLYLTENGKELLSYARHIIDLINEMEHSMRNEEKSGVIKIGASVTVGTYLLPTLVKDFAKGYPYIQINAFIKNTKDIETMITQNTIDFAIIEGIIYNPKIITIPFMDDQLVLVCGKSHPLYKSSPINISELSQHKFIVREKGSGTRELFQNIMAANELHWEMAWESNGSDGLISAAAGGIGISVLSEKLVENQVKSGQLSLIRVKGLSFPRTFSMAYHENKFLTNTMRAFIDLCYNQESKKLFQ